MTEETIEKHLTQFMYMIMRDAAPPGIVKFILNDIDKVRLNGKDIVYTNKYLEQMAREYTRNLMHAEHITYGVKNG